jgi:hypothetical protein
MTNPNSFIDNILARYSFIHYKYFSFVALWRGSTYILHRPLLCAFILCHNFVRYSCSVKEYLNYLSSAMDAELAKGARKYNDTLKLTIFFYVFSHQIFNLFHINLSSFLLLNLSLFLIVSSESSNIWIGRNFTHFVTIIFFCFVISQRPPFDRAVLLLFYLNNPCKPFVVCFLIRLC